MQRVWTDGACKGNPGPGGWAWVAEDRRWASGGEAQSTNQRMEIMAAYRAVRDHDGPVTVVSDSTYVVNCFRDRWWEGWLKRDWKNSQKKPVANRDLWEPFIDLYRSRDQVRFEWVKGHAGDEMNDIADRLAVEAVTRQTEAHGDSIPEDLGEADRTGPTPASGSSAPAAGSGARDGRLPDARLVGIFGLRPTELGGYEANPTSDAVGRRLQEILSAKRLLDEDLHVVSGLRLGAEMLGAEAALAEEIPLIAVLPFPDPDAPWPESSRRRFRELCDRATTVITLERKAPDSKAKVGGSLRRRDAWFARNLDEAIVVWDGQERFTERLIERLRERLGDDVWEELVPPSP
ncbi:MAG: RNase H family protein [Acidimicrobiales bacterium]|nr:RNase H family protein [Acidimicrobiales bacterium]